LFLAPETPAVFALQVGLTVLAVACPCALGLAVPTVISVALGKAAQKGIFFQRPEALESLAQVRRIFMDKTGTLTEGKPKVAWTNAVPQEHAAMVWELASKSQHPLSKSLVNWAKQRMPNLPDSSISQITEVPGFGLEGIWDGTEIRLGAPNWAGPWPTEIAMDASPVILGNGQVTYAAFLLHDAPRPNVLAIMEQLIHLRLMPIVLTGDRNLSSAVRDVLPHQVQIHLSQQPEDKIRAIERAKSEGEIVLMVGDGINDAPALAHANIGISMGEGSYLARQCSHINLGDSNLDLLPEAIRISKQAVRIMRQNMLWALSYNLVALPLAAGILFPFTGHLFNPMWAGMAMAASSVFVVLNSLRLSFS
jgi:P-type E1-E2 ATPase